jgi:hypothetical protein
MVLKAAGGAEYRFTEIGAEGSDDGQRLNLILHVTAEKLDDAAAKVLNTAAAKAILDAHKDLRQGFDGVIVFAEQAGQAHPIVTELKMGEIP